MYEWERWTHGYHRVSLPPLQVSHLAGRDGIEFLILGWNVFMWQTYSIRKRLVSAISLATNLPQHKHSLNMSLTEFSVPFAKISAYSERGVLCEILHHELLPEWLLVGVRNLVGRGLILVRKLLVK